MRGRAPLKARLERSEQLLGALVRMPNEALVELAGLVGLDFVVLDTEHGPGDQVELLHHLVVAQSVGLDALVRVGATGEILRVLDLGATGIIAPHVSSVEEAASIVKAARYSPHGERGLATYTRAGRYGLVSASGHLKAAEAETLVILMIEDSEGVAAASQIAALDGVDGLFVGPADLAHSFGKTGDTTSWHVLDAVTQVHAAAHERGRAVLSIASDTASAHSQFAAGSDLVVYNIQAALGTLFRELAGVRYFESSPAAPEPLVFLPGMLGDARLYESVAAKLVGSASPHFGRIDLDDSVPNMAESVLAAAPPHFALVGHSLGGIVALEIVRRAPERVSRLALLNSSGRPPSEEQLEEWKSLRERAEAGEFVTVIREFSRANLPPGTSADLMDLSDEMGRALGVAGLLRQLAAQGTRPDNRPSLAQITVPTLVVSGALDQVCPPALQSELAAAIPGAVHEILDGVGHMSPIEAPGRVGTLLLDWLVATRCAARTRGTGGASEPLV